MSFILDALKKSEREREQQQSGIQPQQLYGRRSNAQPIWMFAVTGLLLLNLAFLLVLWLRTDHPSAAPMITVNNAPATAAAPAATVSAPPATVGHYATAPEVRPLQDEAVTQREPSDETAALLANAAAPEGPQLVRPLTNNTDSGTNMGTDAGGHLNSKEFAAAVANASNATNNYNRAGQGTVPTLDSLGGNATLGLPPIHLDIHVYSTNSAERFVFINMHKYAEGQTISEGATVEHILPEGAVLTYRGQHFLLPRQ